MSISHAEFMGNLQHIKSLIIKKICMINKLFKTQWRHWVKQKPYNTDILTGRDIFLWQQADKYTFLPYKYSSDWEASPVCNHMPQHTALDKHRLSVGPSLWCSNLCGHTEYIDGLVQDCSNSSAWALELLQSCTKPLACKYWWPSYFILFW